MLPLPESLLLSRLKQHIDTVVGRYKGQIYAWDVVNEAVEDKTDLFMRDTKWLEPGGGRLFAASVQYGS